MRFNRKPLKLRRLPAVWIPLLLVLLLPVLAQGACVCGTGRMLNWFPGTAPIVIDGTMGEWDSVIASPNNNICDGAPGTALTDLDAPIQSTGRDLMQFTYTYDSNYVYAYTQRYASDSNTDNFIYYADTNNDGLMETGEPVVVVSWQGSNRNVGVYLGTYRSYYASGDPMVCTPGSTGAQSCTSGYADGYHLPGTVANLPAGGHPTYTGTWGSATGTEMEWRVSWADLGLAANPGTPFTFHVSSTNSQPGAGSFPAQVDDNMGGCGGKGGTTQYAGAGITPNSTVSLTTATVYTVSHTLTNTGNGSDNFTLSSTVTGSNNPIPTVTYSYNGQTFTDTSTLGAAFSIPAGESIVITEQFTFPSSPASKSYTVTTTAKSKFDTNVSAQATDTLTSQEVIAIANKTVGGYGTFSYSAGTNGLPAALTLTTGLGNDPAASAGYVILNTGKSASITEAIPAGWLFGSGSCIYASTGTALAPANYSFAASSGSVVLTVAAAAFTGDNVNCTFTNNKLPVITVNKLLGGNRVSDSDQFTVQLLNGGTVVAAGSSTGSGDVVTSGSGSFSYVPSGTGISYTLGETKSAGPTAANVYAPLVTCTNNDVPVATPSALGQIFTPGIGDNYSCWITNTPPLLTIKKLTYSGTGVFSFAGTNGVSSSFSLDTTTGNPVAQSFSLAAVNTSTAVSETALPAGWALNDASCVDGSGNAVTTTVVNGTLTIPGSAIVAGRTLVCTFANVWQPNLLITKSSDSSQAVPGQVVTYTIHVSNSGGSASSVYLTDALSPYTALKMDSYAGAPFSLVDGTGAAASNLQLGTPLYSKNNGASWDYTPSATGYDGNVTNWKIPMVGTMNGWAGSPNPYPTLTISYKTQVK